MTAQDAAAVESKPVCHIIGTARTIQTAVLAVAYLRERIPWNVTIDPGQIRYRFTDPTPKNGWWSAEILIETGSLTLDPAADALIDICRAFVAGRGEIWA
jgi:hypothetical protein